MQVRRLRDFRPLRQFSQESEIYMSPDKQTMLSWSRPIKSYDMVPNCFKDFFMPFIANRDPFPYCVFTPAFEGVHVRSNEKLVCASNHEIHVLTRTDGGFDAVCFPLEKVSYVKIKTTLLDSRVTISGFTDQGNLATTMIPFNSAGTYIGLKKIGALTLHAKGKGPLALCIKLITNESFKPLFQASSRPEIERLRASFDEMAGTPHSASPKEIAANGAVDIHATPSSFENSH